MCTHCTRNTVRGNLFLLRKSTRHLTRSVSGPVVRIAPYHADIVDVSAKKQIYTVKEDYRKSDWYTRMMAPGITSMFSTSDVEFHRRHRRLLSSGMTESNIKTLEAGIMWKMDLCMQRMREEMESRGAVDVFKWFMFLATDVIGELAFGDSFHMLERGKVCIPSVNVVLWASAK